MKWLIIFLPACLLYQCGAAQTAKPYIPEAPAVKTIKETGLKTDLYQFASDRFRGREAGTLDEFKGASWLAEKARSIGLKPAGDDGTFFQFFSMKRSRVASNSSVKIGDTNLPLWRDVIVAETVAANLNVPIVFVNDASKEGIQKLNIERKAVAIMASANGIDLGVSLPERRYYYLLEEKYAYLVDKGAAAIIFISDELGERSWRHIVPELSRGEYDIEGGLNEQYKKKRLPVFWVHGNAANLLKQTGVRLRAMINIDQFDYPSVNVIGKVEGTDPSLSDEYILFSAHHDHDGIRQPYGTDSIYNGADDNGSACAALLSIARAFKEKPGKRSVLFVWHGAEERGLLGSQWYATHPTVAKKSIVAVLNADMIGRNNPDSAALLGSQLPHRNSSELVKMALDANQEGPGFKLDTLWDKPAHPEIFYFRSDHVPYAIAGIPSVFFTTMLHSEYHTPMDEASHIDYKKLTRMTQWMYRTGWKIANSKERVRADNRNLW